MLLSVFMLILMLMLMLADHNVVLNHLFIHSLYWNCQKMSQSNCFDLIVKMEVMNRCYRTYISLSHLCNESVFHFIQFDHEFHCFHRYTNWCLHTNGVTFRALSFGFSYWVGSYHMHLYHIRTLLSIFHHGLPTDSKNARPIRHADVNSLADQLFFVCLSSCVFNMPIFCYFIYSVKDWNNIWFIDNSKRWCCVCANISRKYFSTQWFMNIMVYVNITPFISNSYFESKNHFPNQVPLWLIITNMEFID